MQRCKWCNLKNQKYVEYHDKEWGRLKKVMIIYLKCLF